ncbi:MAG: hypothetical protein WDN24_10700 [Sphingomonas sp.]
MKLFVQSSNGTKRPLLIDQKVPLGGGGEGKIYADANNKGVAIKLFSQVDRKRKAKITAMMARPPALSNGAGTAQLAWPTGLVVDSLGALHGLAMPRIDTKNYGTLETLLIAGARSKENMRGDSAADYRFRVTVARNLAAAVALIHEAGHALVDIKPMNVLVHRQTGAVAIVDCDGCRITGPNGAFPAVVATEEYLAPEFHGKVQDADIRQDQFALPLVIFRLLNNDLLPMTGIPHDPAAPTTHVGRIKAKLLTVNPAAPIRQHAKSIQGFLPEKTVELFRSSFSHAYPLRPKAEKWVAHLDWLMTQLQTCRANSNHVAMPAGCPWCAQEKRRTTSGSSKPKPVPAPAAPAPPKPVPQPPAKPAMPNRQAPAVPGHLITARILALPFAVIGFGLIALVLAGSAILVYALFTGLEADLNLIGKAAYALSYLGLFGAMAIVMGFPFYYAYINSYALERRMQPERVWPSFVLGFPAAAIAVPVGGALAPWVAGPDSIARGLNGWTGIGAIAALGILLFAVGAVGQVLRLVFIAFVGLWSKAARNTFMSELDF